MRSRRTLRLRIGAGIVVGLIAAFARAGHYRWTTAGPEPGLVSQVLVDPQNPDRLGAVAGFYGQFVFWSSDRGQTWAQDPTLVYAQRLVSDPSNGSVLYAFGSAANATGVFKTIDGGLSWAPAGSGLPGGILSQGLSLAPSAPNVLYLVVGSPTAQVYRSDDGAGSWSLTSGTFMTSYVGDVEVDPSNPAVAYVVGYPGIFKTTDSGASWAPAGSFADALRVAIDPTHPSTLYVATGDSGVWKSTDGGMHWSPSNTGIETANVRDIAIDPGNPQRLWIAASTSGALVSDDGGQSWTPVDLGPAARFATAIAVDPGNSARVYAAAGPSTLRGGLLASADGGVTWTPRSQGLSGFLSDGVAADSGAGGIAHCVSDANFWESDDAGASWVLKGQAAYFLTSLVADPSTATTFYAAYGSSGVNGVLKSVDAGASWDSASDGLVTSTLHRLVVSPGASDHLLAATLDGLFATSNGAGLWTNVLTGDVRAAALDPADPSILYAGLWTTTSPADALLRSADGGATWNPPAGLPTSYPHVIDVAVPGGDASHVYVAVYGSGGTQGVYRSADRGLTFEAASAGLPGSFTPTRLAGDPSDAATLFVAGGPAPGAAPEGAFRMPTTAPVANVFRTRDGASTWIPLPYLPTFNVADMNVAADGRTLYASTLSGVFTFYRSFVDVPDSDLFWAAVDAAAMNGVTVGCGSGRFCPTNPTSRASVAVFLLRGKNGGSYVPPPATGTVFGDVPGGSPAADFIEELAREGITSGCGGGDFCPSQPVSRAGMAVLLLKTLHGASFVPPPATGMVFGDVPMDAFAAPWIEGLFHEGISAGCGGGNFCPNAVLTRAQAAALVVRAFGLL